VAVCGELLKPLSKNVRKVLPSAAPRSMNMHLGVVRFARAHDELLGRHWHPGPRLPFFKDSPKDNLWRDFLEDTLRDIKGKERSWCCSAGWRLAPEPFAAFELRLVLAATTNVTMSFRVTRWHNI